MRAVNLIPADQRKGAGGAAGRAGGAVYVLLGGLVVLVLMSVLYAVSANQASDRQAKLTSVSTQADAVQAQATALQPYVSFAAIRQSREQGISSLITQRFDWAAAMDQIARSLPHDVTLTALTGAPTGAATPTATSAAPATTPATPATPAAPATPVAPAAAAAGPSVALAGCASTHSEVATVLVDLRRIVGVTGVSLATSQKANGPATGVTACPGAAFTATLVYAANSAAATTTPNNGVTGATATSPTAGSIR